MQNILNTARGIFRFFIFFIVISLYFIVATVKYFLNSDPIKRRNQLILNTQFFSCHILKAFNINLICKNPVPVDEISLVIGNHMGFIDVVCLQSILPSVFITSTEMRDTPVLGQIANLAGCSYVDRNNRINIQHELNGIIQVLKNGFRVALYPEAMASNGEQVLPFKKTLIMAGPVANCAIRPYVFNYCMVNDRPVNYKDRDSLCWYGDQTFQASIWRSLQLKNIVCEIEFLPLMHFAPDADRTEVSISVHDVIADKFVAFKQTKKLK